MSIENALWLAGIVIEVAVVGLLLYKRIWRVLPIFSAYCAWDLLSNAGNLGIRYYYIDIYRTVYLIETVVDSLLVFGVLIEIGWSVLRPIRSHVPRASWLGIGLFLVICGSLIWPFTGIHTLANLPYEIEFIVRIQQTTSVLRILLFLLMAGCSQLLSIGWRDRELQVATGLGFYSLVSLAAAMLRTHQTSLAQYGHLNQIVVASYVISLLYWALAFAQKEAARREFTPKMEQFLLALAGNARAARLAMATSSDEDSQSGRHS